MKSILILACILMLSGCTTYNSPTWWCRHVVDGGQRRAFIELMHDDPTIKTIHGDRFYHPKSGIYHIQLRITYRDKTIKYASQQPVFVGQKIELIDELMPGLKFDEAILYAARDKAGNVVEFCDKFN